MLKDGLYEQITNKSLDAELAITDKLSKTAPIDSAEASKVLAKQAAEVVKKGLDNLTDNGSDVNEQVVLANRIITAIISETCFYTTGIYDCLLIQIHQFSGSFACYAKG